MNRREAISLLALLSLPLSGAQGQQPTKFWRLGWLAEGGDPGPGHRTAGAFFEGLRDLGYIESRNLRIDFRFAEGNAERLARLATELVELKPDIIAAPGTRELVSLKKATSTIPIVMVYAGDPVRSGLVASLARPEANITGTTMMSGVGGKRLDLLRDLVPGLRQIAIIGNLENAAAAAEMRSAEAAAVEQGLRARLVSAESSQKLDEGLEQLARDPPDGLLVIQDNFVFAHRQRIADFSLQHRLVSIFSDRAFVVSGGLIGYGPSMVSIGKRAAVYVDKILKGAKPGDLPIEQPKNFELVVNLRTAKAIGLAIPPTLLARADEVIE